MKNISDLQVTQVRIFAVDVIPLRMLITATALAKIKQLFKFANVEPEIVQGGSSAEQDLSTILSFSFGEYSDGASRIAIRNLSIESRRIVIRILGTSAQADSIFNNLRKTIGELGQNNQFLESEPIVTVDETNCVVSLNFDFSECFSKPIMNFLHHNLNVSTSSKSADASTRPFRLAAEIRYQIKDQSIIDNAVTLNPKSFIIEARPGTPASQRRFFTSSPTDSDTHLQLIENFESLFRS